MYKRARSAVKALLQFFFPKEFSRLALKPDVFAATFPKGETGAKLSELAEDSNGAMFELDREQCVVYVMGEESQVELGMLKLKSLEEEYRRRVREIKVPLSAVRAIIGKKVQASRNCRIPRSLNTTLFVDRLLPQLGYEGIQKNCKPAKTQSMPLWNNLKKKTLKCRMIPKLQVSLLVRKGQQYVV